MLQRQADSSLLTRQLAGLDASLSAVSSQLSNMESSVTALSETVEENSFKVGNLDARIDESQQAIANEEEFPVSQEAGSGNETANAVVRNEVQLAAETEVPVTGANTSNLVEGIQDLTASTKGSWREFMDSGYLRSLVPVSYTHLTLPTICSV